MEKRRTRTRKKGPADTVKARMTGEERRSQIVRVATELFSEKGFKGTTTREIASRAGISEAVIFRHFSKKEDLYSAIIDSRCTDSRGQSRLMSILKDKSGREIFREVASFIISEHQKDSSFLRLLTFSALENQGLADMFISTKGVELIGFLEERIKGLMDEGKFRKTDAALAARAFLGMVLHYGIAQEIYGLKREFKRPNEKVAEMFVDIFFEGMERR